MGLPPTGDGGTALVTGASSGIGLELARQLAAKGRSLTLVARRERRLSELADELRRDHRVDVEVVAADLGDAASRAELPERLHALGRRVEILCNNAGLTTFGPVHRARREEELALVRTDVEAVVDLCTLFLPPMVERRRGAVLNTASCAAFQPLPGQAAYGAAKSFVLSYGWSLRGELRGTGVTVTTLCPGPVATGFAEAGGMSEEVAGQALPRIMWLPASEVAAAGLRGLEQGRAVVVPGAANRVSAVAGHLAPRSVVTPLLASQHPALRST